MNRQDWILLTLAAAKVPMQPVQLQKALFLMSKNIPARVLGKNFYTFDPYDYGPFCKAIYDDAEILESQELVEVTRPPVSRFNIYAATSSGKSKATELHQGLSAKVLDYSNRVVEFVQSVSFNELVSAIYKAYPDMQENSVFRG